MNRTHGRRRGLRRVLAIVAMAVLAGVAGSVPAVDALPVDPVDQVVATVADLQDASTYVVRTTYRRPDGRTFTRNTGGAVLVPTAVNVEPSPLSLPDLSVTVTPAPNRVSVAVRRLLTAPKVMPVTVELIFDVPGRGLQLAAGYDALATQAPQSFTAAVTFKVGTVSTELGLDVDTAKAPASLGLIGELFQPGADGLRTESRRVRVDLAPVPSALAVDATVVATPDFEAVEAQLTTDTETRAGVVVDDHRGSGRRVLDATIANLPTRTTVTYENDEATGTQHVVYDADSRIAHVDLSLTDTERGQPQRTITGHLDDLPTHFEADIRRLSLTENGEPVDRRQIDYTAAQPISAADLTVDQFEGGVLRQEARLLLSGIPSAFSLVTDRRGVDDPETAEDERTTGVDLDLPEGSPGIGRAEAGIADGRTVTFPDPRVFFKPEDELPDAATPGYAIAGNGAIGFLLHGVQDAVVDTREPLVVHGVAAPGPFAAQLGLAGQTLTTRALNLPGDATIQFFKSSKFLAYKGSADIDRLVLDVENPLGVVGRATRATLTATGVPTDVRVSLGSSITVTAPGSVGTADVLLTSGPGPSADNVLPGLTNGVSVEDLPDRFVVAGRVLELTHFRLDMPPERRSTFPGSDLEDATTRLTATVDRAPGFGHPLQVHLDSEPRGKPTYLDAATQIGSHVEFKLERHALRPSGVDSGVPCRLLAPGECEEAMRLTLEGSPGLTSDALELNTNAGDRDNLVVKVPDLPDRIEVCVSTFDHCSGAVRNVETASLSIDSSEPVNVTLFDCVEAKFTCVPGETDRDKAEQFLQAFVRVTFLQFDMTKPLIQGGDIGHIFLNTTRFGGRFGISGRLFLQARSQDPCTEGKVKAVDAQLVNVSADRRFFPFEFEQPSGENSCTATGIKPHEDPDNPGSITCGNATFIDGEPKIPAVGNIADQFCNPPS